MKVVSKPKSEKKITIFLEVIFLLALIIYLKVNKVTGLVGQENYFFFSSQALLNGINTSRGYGTDIHLNDIISKILFNKSFFPIMYFFEFVNQLFRLFISFVMSIIN